MNRARVIGLIVLVLAASAAWFAFRVPPPPPPAPTPVPTREAFHVSKPLGVEVVSAAPESAWLAGELRHLLIHGKMKVAPLGSSVPTFVMRVALNETATEARVTLVAPDQVEERNVAIVLATDSRLATLRSFAERLPAFLGAPGDASAWLTAAGTDDAGAYDAFLNASDALLSSNAAGFTAPPASPEMSQTLERIEALARRQRNFARARALLSLAYLSVGGNDQTSLAKLSETAAERALTANAQLADAHAALGIVRLRRMDWSTAQEHFNAALAIDANSVAALEGLGCLLLDTGHTKEALPIVTRITALQPGNRGARQCAAYAAISQQQLATTTEQPFDTAKIYATMLLLGGDRNGAESLLKSSFKQSNELIESVVAASATQERSAAALQAITRSADEDIIDAETEMLFGTALRRPDFVFNRMLRLAKQNEAAPLRLLWLPQTEFLRKHRRFKEVVSATSLTTYWQDHGVPDICTPEPKVAGCAVKPK